MPKLPPIKLSKSLKPDLLAHVSSGTFRPRLQENDDGSVDLLIYDFIGDPWSDSDDLAVAEFLQAHSGKPVNVRINSPGGFAFDGVTIYNALVQHNGPVTTVIEGLAGSAASIVAMAGDPIQMAGNGTLFIHRAAGIAFGNVEDMQWMVDFLSQLDDRIAATYAAQTGKPAEEMLALMVGDVDGTTMGAEAAKELGFIDEILPLGRKSAPSDPEALNRARAELLKREREGQHAKQLVAADLARKIRLAELEAGIIS